MGTSARPWRAPVSIRWMLTALLGSYPATSRLEHRPTPDLQPHDYMQPSRAVGIVGLRNPLGCEDTGCSVCASVVVFRERVCVACVWCGVCVCVFVLCGVGSVSCLRLIDSRISKK